MKVLAGLLWASTALEACTVSAQALLYTSEPVSPPSKQGPPPISPITARLLLAQRLGLSQYHSLEDADEATLEILNTYGGEQRRIFEDENDVWGDESSGAEKFLLIIEGVSEPEDILGPSRSPAVSIQHQPTSSQNLELALDLLEQDRQSKSAHRESGLMQIHSSSPLRGGLSASRTTSWHALDDSRLFNLVFQSEKPGITDYTRLLKSIDSKGRGHTTILHDSSLQGLTPKDGNRYTAALSDLKAAIDYFFRLNGPVGTLIIMPATPKTAKRSTTSSYGTYTKPLSTRQQQQQPEEPLSSPSTPSTHRPSAPEILQASTSPLPHGVLPICHPSLESAKAATNNCSGHGEAYKKSSREGEIECFACKCSKTVLTADNGGVKTVYWGGPACQKKDISVPFFLLAGLSIALVGAVAWGIGLMASIGQEELPSVIGAGVTGPRAQK